MFFGIVAPTCTVPISMQTPFPEHDQLQVVCKILQTMTQPVGKEHSSLKRAQRTSTQETMEVPSNSANEPWVYICSNGLFAGLRGGLLWAEIFTFKMGRTEVNVIPPLALRFRRNGLPSETKIEPDHRLQIR